MLPHCCHFLLLCLQQQLPYASALLQRLLQAAVCCIVCASRHVLRQRQAKTWQLQPTVQTATMCISNAMTRSFTCILEPAIVLLI
jgi:hypothetical protein